MSDEAKPCPFDETYFLRGKEAGVSLYENYHWLPDLTIPMCQAIARYLFLTSADTVLDFGCARGFLVKALRLIGFKAFGVDVSEWALANCDPEVKKYLFYPPGFCGPADWIIAKDVLEHVGCDSNEFPLVILKKTIDGLLARAKKGFFAVVPLATHDDDDYVIADYEKDVTHVHRMTLASWVDLFVRPGWEVTASYRLKGVKDNYAQHPTGNGFITARRTT